VGPVALCRADLQMYALTPEHTKTNTHCTNRSVHNDSGCMNNILRQRQNADCACRRNCCRGFGSFAAGGNTRRNDRSRQTRGALAKPGTDPGTKDLVAGLSRVSGKVLRSAEHRASQEGTSRVTQTPGRWPRQESCLWQRTVTLRCDKHGTLNVSLSDMYIASLACDHTRCCW
jgi:hypothetical protein